MLGVELVARGLDTFSRDQPSLARTVQLPDWECSSKMAWPASQVPLAALMAQSIGPQVHPGADWAAALTADNVRRKATEACWTEEEKARQAERRRDYEAHLLQTDRHVRQNSG